WTDVDVERALIHEIEHVHRADWPIRFTARIVCALYWFHPLAWAMWRRLCLESEHACDDAVVQGNGRCGERTASAEQLVTLAGRSSIAMARPVLAMASRRDLSARIRAVLDGRQSRGRAGFLRIAAIAAAATAVVFGISPLRAPPQTG